MFSLYLCVENVHVHVQSKTAFFGSQIRPDPPITAFCLGPTAHKSHHVNPSLHIHTSQHGLLVRTRIYQCLLLCIGIGVCTCVCTYVRM